jgi:hypothetical protein
MHFAPAGMETWGYSADARFVKTATVVFDLAVLSEQFTAEFDADAIATPRLRFSDDRIWTPVRLLSEALNDPDPSTQLYGDGLIAAIVRAIHAHPFRPKMVGASMIGPQNTAVKTTLGPLLNGFVNYEYWAPVPKMMFTGVQEFLDTYQARAGDAGVDLLGHYTAPLAYAQMQVIAQAVEAAGSLDDIALSSFTKDALFSTVMGDVKFGKNGEWADPRVLQLQFQGIAGHEADQFKDGSRQAVVAPNSMASGRLIFPHAEAL